MKGIFISYRRQDSQGAAGRLADHLRDHMAGVPIFRDVETIEPGVDFVEAIGRALESCGILLAVIGPRWTTMTDASGKSRLDDPGDYARLEIATALRRGDVRVIPVLVEGAEMPGADTLPEELKPLARRNAIELTDKRWEFDVSMLIETLRKALGQTAPPPPPPPPPPVRSSWKKWAWGVVGALVVVVALVIAEQEGGVHVQPTVLPSVIGVWQDAEGGRYQIVQQGAQVAFQGTSIYGPSSGAGMVQGNQYSFSYTLNGAPYQAVLFLSPDGLQLRGQYRSLNGAESGLLAFQRIQ